MNYSIIVPFYNEEKNVSKLNKELIEILKIYFKETIRKFEAFHLFVCYLIDPKWASDGLYWP